MSRFFQPSAAFGPAASSLSLSGLWLTTTLLLLVSFLPTGVFYLWGAPSHATGVVIASGVLALVYAIAPERSRGHLRFEGWMSVVIGTMVALAIHFLIASWFNPTVIDRAGLSLLALVALLSGSYFLFAVLMNVNDASLEWAASLIRIAFIGFAVFGILGIQPAGATELISNEKSVFPFAEPSHFAIAFSPFLLHGAAVNRGWRQLLWILIGFGVAYLLENLTLLVATTLTALICLPLSRLLAAGLTLGAGLGALDLEYYLQRLDLRYSEHISVLVYRQGWELVADALQRTRGWGVGFQQLGYVPFNSPSADMLFRVLRSDSNILDGGFGAAKLLGELGPIGMALIGGYVYFAVRLGWSLRKSIVRGTSLPPKLVFASAVICGFAVEIFVRGLGYFSGSALLLVAALLTMRSVERTSGTVAAAHTAAVH